MPPKAVVSVFLANFTAFSDWANSLSEWNTTLVYTSKQAETQFWGLGAKLKVGHHTSTDQVVYYKFQI